MCISFSRMDSGLSIHHLFVWSNLNFLQNSQWITFPPSRISSYTLFVLIYYFRFLWDWSFRLYHHLIYICYFVVSCLFCALTLCVLIASFWAAIKRDSFSFLRFSFLSHVQVFSCEISLVCRLKSPCRCFSSHFCFLVIFVLLIFVLSVLFLVTVISLPLYLCIAAIRQVFAELPPALVEKACSQFRIRIEAVIEAEGGYIE